VFSLRKCFYTAAIAGTAAAFSISTAQGQGTSTTICKDGTPSAASGRAACSSHGGVDKAATSKAKKAAKAAKKQAKKEAKAAKKGAK
jgi:hypothetical protein